MGTIISVLRPTTTSVKSDTSHDTKALTPPAPDPGFRFLDLPVEMREQIIVEAIAGDVNPVNLLLVAQPLEALVVNALYRVLNTALTEQKKYGGKTITQAQWLQLQKPACFLGRIAKKARSNPLPSPIPNKKIEEYAEMPQRIRDAGAHKMETSLLFSWCPGENERNNSYNALKTTNVILDAYRTGATEISIDSFRLSTWPKEIAYLTNLRVLYASRNHFRALPEWIGQLSRLEKLFVEENYIESLSPKIGRLSALKEFSVSLNHLQDLDPEIGQLVKLKYLNISENSLRRLPDTIEYLTDLQVLDVSSNALEMLPKQLVNLKSLRSFEVSNNRLTVFPNEIKLFLKALEEFRYRNNLGAIL